MKHTTKEILQTPRFTVVEHQVTRPNGELACCTAVEHPGAVVILPMVGKDQICLIKNYRLTVSEELIELPAGTREPGESPEQVALRELKEETGYSAGNIEPLAQFYTSPGICDEFMHAYVATDLTPGPPAREENEQIENLVVTWSEARQMIEQGKIKDGKTLTTLLLYERTLQSF